MIKGIIFDLDMCILDTRSLTGPFFEPVLNPLYASSLSDEFKKEINDMLWTTSLDDVVEILSVPENVAEPMRQGYRDLDVPDGIYSFGDEQIIANLNTINILVTTGYKKFQNTKIEMLGIRNLFDEVIIDELDYRKDRKKKKKIFSELLEKYDWGKDEVLVVGDNPHSELGAGKALGIKTVQTLRESIDRWEEADYHVTHLSELETLLG